ncbi:MAG: hypothetical protein ABIR19_04780 [Ginsengibacter sp.]
MNETAKIQLSKFEIDLVSNAQWILTKQEIIKKVYSLFGIVHDLFKKIAEDKIFRAQHFDAHRGGKISRGENYLGLPYVILDFPSFFQKEDIFAIRSMFWWGNFFSITLHISGKKSLQKVNLQDILSLARDSDFYICVNSNEWQHHFLPDNFIRATELDNETLKKILSKDFFKMAARLDVKEWTKALPFFEEKYQELITIIEKTSAKGRKP